MNIWDDLLGEICKTILPIYDECYMGDTDSTIAICTLSSINLLRQIADSTIINKIALAGRLFSENKGIDSLVKYVNLHKINKIIVCGKEVSGHLAGHSLVQLYRNGTDAAGRIRGSSSPHPYLTVSKSEIAYFQNNITLVNQIGVTDITIIKRFVQ